VFSRAATAAYTHLADFGISFDQVRVVIVRPPSDTVKDTVIAFTPGQADATLDLTVDVHSNDEIFNAAVDYTDHGAVVFHGVGTVQAHAADQSAPPQQIVLNYTGPGANVARITVIPKTTTVVSPNPTPFSVAAFDSGGTPVPQVPLNWSTSDVSLATISSAGVLTPTGKRGAVTVTAATPNSVRDSASATITLPATAIGLLSGGGQSGKAGSTLSQSATVRVVASDGVGVSGITVNFAAPAGGSVGAASVVTDANGSASSSLRLGTVAGAQSFVAAAGAYSVAIPAMATAADPAAIAVVSGAGQSDTVKKTLKNLLVVKVSDQYGNATPNIVVSWSGGGGSFSSPTSTTGADGMASVVYTLGTTSGDQTITASTSGVSAPATFTVQAVAAPPAAVVIVSGNAQSGRVLQALAAPFVVRVNDAAGNPIGGAPITWTAINGTLAAMTTTDSLGLTSNVFTVGKTPGAASAVASTANGKTATFTASAQAGIVAKLFFRTTPTAGIVGTVLTPPIQLELQDASGNATAAANGVTIALGANPSQAILGGTLTKTSVAGVATFDDLKLDHAGVGYTLVATSAGLPPITSAPFSVVPPVPSAVVAVGGNSQVYPDNFSGARGALVVLVKDSIGTPVPGVQVTYTAAGQALVNGTTSAVATTGVDGTASVSAAAATDPGSGTVSAVVAGLPPVSFTVARVSQGSWGSVCALTTSKAAYCWGDNSYGTIGDGTTSYANLPTPVSGGLIFSAGFTSGYGSHQCGLVAGGQAYCWGRNTFGEVGDNSTVDRSQPVAVQGGHTFTSIVTSSYSTCGLTTAAQVYCWGWTAGGTLGDGDAGSIRLVPTLVNTAGKVYSQIVVLDDFACGLEAGGVVSCWGQAPDGTHLTPVVVSTADRFTSLTAGFYQLCGLTSAGAADCWGRGVYGETGLGVAGIQSVPARVTGGLTFAEIRAFAYNTCGRTTGNTLYCWGYNSSGGVGDGSTTDRSEPTAVLGGIPFGRIIGGGMGFACGQSTGGQPFCWGSGALGNGVTSGVTSPYPVRWVEGTVSAPASVLMNSGNNLTATAGTAVSPTPSVIVRNYAGNPVSGVSVTFTVVSGAGTISSNSTTTVQTDANGVATPGPWVIQSGTNTLSADVAGVGHLLFIATGT
jgi:alpha-tubulin suppressor-like RCC1 family protein